MQFKSFQNFSENFTLSLENLLNMRNASPTAKKIIALKKNFSVKRNETLAQYYLRIYGHLLNDIQIWEVDEKDNFYKL